MASRNVTEKAMRCELRASASIVLDNDRLLHTMYCITINIIRLYNVSQSWDSALYVLVLTKFTILTAIGCRGY